MGVGSHWGLTQDAGDCLMFYFRFGVCREGPDYSLELSIHNA